MTKVCELCGTEATDAGVQMTIANSDAKKGISVWLCRECVQDIDDVLSQLVLPGQHPSTRHRPGEEGA